MLKNISVKFIVEDPSLTPKYATDGSAGFDFVSKEDFTLIPGRIHSIGTGVKVVLPTGYELQVRGRSGLAFKHGVSVLNSPGTVDSDYRGEIRIALINHGFEVVNIKKGDRIAQGIVSEYTKVNFEEVSVEEFNSLSTERGDNGFGSTGK